MVQESAPSGMGVLRAVVLPLPGCVTLEQWLSLSGPQCPYLYNREDRGVKMCLKA
jgi:hypothetical protein